MEDGVFAPDLLGVEYPFYEFVSVQRVGAVVHFQNCRKGNPLQRLNGGDADIILSVEHIKGDIDAPLDDYHARVFAPPQEPPEGSEDGEYRFAWPGRLRGFCAT